MGALDAALGAVGAVTAGAEGAAADALNPFGGNVGGVDSAMIDDE